MAQQPVQRRGIKHTRHKKIHVMSAATQSVRFHAQSNLAMLIIQLPRLVQISIIVLVNMQQRKSNNCKGQGNLVNILLFQWVNSVLSI